MYEKKQSSLVARQLILACFALQHNSALILAIAACADAVTGWRISNDMLHNRSNTETLNTGII